MKGSRTLWTNQSFHV